MIPGSQGLNSEVLAYHSCYRRSRLHWLPHLATFLRSADTRSWSSTTLVRGYVKACSACILIRIDLQDTDKLTDLLDRNRRRSDPLRRIISVGESTQKPVLYFDNNIAGSLSLFEAMMEAVSSALCSLRLRQPMERLHGCRSLRTSHLRQSIRMANRK